jgi:aminomethyltransferase
MSTGLAETPLYGWHAAHQGRMVDFAGWSMPVQYESIVAEHTATRQAVGLFDISHMGRLRVAGAGAAELLNSVVTRDVTKLAVGQIAYALVTRDDGGILDDVLVYHLRDGAGDSYYLLVVNASNREKIVQWIRARGQGADSVEWSDVTMDWGMVAVQGPRAVDLVARLTDMPVSNLGYYQGEEARIAGSGGIVSRTGYTGEDGFELIVGAAALPRVWDALVEDAEREGGRAVGLGARDTLRLEAGMPLYGHELSEEITPLHAGLGFAVRTDKADYPGREALARWKQSPPDLVRVGLTLEGKRVPRQGYGIVLGGERVGEVTSGTYSPTLDRPIAMGYVTRAAGSVGRLGIDLRGKIEEATVAALPFYRRAD